MENLRRLGGEAGLVAGIATAWVFLGFVYIFPTVGLDFVDQINPHRYLPFITKHQALVWTVHILGGLLSAIGAAVLFAALQDRFNGSASGMNAKIGAGAGLFGAGMLAAAALVRQAGFDTLSTLYATNATGGAYAFYAIRGVVHSLESMGALAIGIGILVLGRVMSAERKYATVGQMSIIVGLVMAFAAFASHVLLFMVSALAMTGWLIFTSWTLRAEVGPAYISKWFVPRKRRANGVRKAA